MHRKPRKGDRLVYTGGYATEYPDGTPLERPIDPYPPGVAVRFRNYGTKVTVRLDGEKELYADWPVDEVEFAEEKT